MAVRALFALSKEEAALNASRAGGGVGAIFSAMASHPGSAQVVQEGTRALEKHCPRAVAAAARLCGDIARVLPPVLWSAGPPELNVNASLFNLEEIKANGWDPQRIENFMGDLSPKDNGDREDEDEASNDHLETAGGFRKRGLRDDVDAADQRWMGVGTIKVKLGIRGSPAHDVLQRDLDSLSKQGCDMNVLRQPGPDSDQLRGLCDALSLGAGPKKYTAQDGELLALLLGHFAWNSSPHALEIIANGGVKGLITWLKTDRFKGNADPHLDTLAFPMQRACLSALSCLCRHGEDPAAAALEFEAEEVALRYVGHLEISVRIAAFRLLARLIPHAARRSPKQESLSADTILPHVMKEMRSEDEVMRTVATACALEGILDGWLSGESAHTEDLAVALIDVLDQATTLDSSAAALPALIAVAHMASTEEESEDAVVQAIVRQDSLVSLLIAWLPKAALLGAVPAAQAAGLAAANTLRTLSEIGAALNGSELASLLRYGTTVSAEPALREACGTALGFAVQREHQCELLVQLLTGRLRLASTGEEHLADLEVLILIAQRAESLLKQDPNQASEHLLMELEEAEKMVPEETKGSRDLQTMIEELTGLAGRITGTIDVASKLQDAA